MLFQLDEDVEKLNRKNYCTLSFELGEIFILIWFRVLIRMIRQPGLSLAINLEVGNKG